MLSLSLGAVPAGPVARWGWVARGLGGRAAARRCRRHRLGVDARVVEGTVAAQLHHLLRDEGASRADRVRLSGAGPARRSVAGRATVHLVGHSFGARLVTAAADGMPGAKSVGSLSLLQAAFSHNSFAKQWQPGRRRRIPPRWSTSTASRGPIDHHPHPQRQGRRHRVRDRLAASPTRRPPALGDADSPFGGLGSNGAQHTAGGRQRPGAPGRRRDLPLRARRHPQPARRPVRLAVTATSATRQVANAVLQNILAAPLS